MNPLFPASNAQDYANAYTGGFDPSESSGTSTRTTPTMSAGLGGFDASAACDNGGDAYPSFDAARILVPPPLPSSFDPEHPFAELYPATQNCAFDAAYGNGSFEGGALDLSLVHPQVGVVPAYALSHAPVPNQNVNSPFHAVYRGMQHPDVGGFNGGAMAAPNPLYPVYHAPPHPPAFEPSLSVAHTDYRSFASPNQYEYLPAPPVDMSAKHPTVLYEFQHVEYEYEHHDDAAGSVGVQSPLVPAHDVEAPPARGRKGKAKKSTAKAKSSRPRKQKDIDPPAAPVAGSSRLVDDDGYAAQDWRDLDAQGSIPSFLALQNANIGVQHAPLAPSVRGGYPDGDVQDSDNNDIARGQSQGLSVGDQSVATTGPPSTWTGPGASKAEQVRDEDGRLAVHELIPEAERDPPVPGKGVIVCKAPPVGKDLYCHHCWSEKRIVFWQDNDGLRKHNRTKHSTQRGDNSVPHACILECGWSKRSTQATHFVEHRLRHCRRYRELKKDGGRALDEFLTERKLHGHWQLKGKRKA